MKPRAPRKPPMTITVKWDDTRGRYIVGDEQGQLLGVDRDLNNAIGSAVREANLASKAGVKVTVMAPGKGGKLERAYVAQALKP